MRSPRGGQTRQSAGDDRDVTVVRRWATIDGDVLREFALELCARLTYRGAQAATGISKAALQKIVEGVSQPNHTTRQRLGELLLALYPHGAMWKKSKNGEWEMRVHLFELLPPGEDEARAELAKIFELARRFPGEVPASAGRVHEWMDLQIRGEYWGQRHLDSFGARRRSRRGGANPAAGGASRA